MDLATVDHLLTTTRSVRKRLDLTRPVEPEVIERCLEIAVQAPTGSNMQGWHFVVVTEPELKRGLAELYGKSFAKYATSRVDEGQQAPASQVRDSAVFLAQRLVESHPDAENLFWLGEAYRTLGPRTERLTDKELTNSAKKNAAKKREKRTIEEEERELLATPAGQENWKLHRQKAEESYLQATTSENPVAVAHRGLGMLYEKLARPSEAGRL